jgi:hypothetical protein
MKGINIDINPVLKESMVFKRWLCYQTELSAYPVTD